MGRMLLLLVAVLTAISVPQSSSPAEAQAQCQFVLGFAQLHSQLQGSDGACVDNEHDDPNRSGDRVQTTTKGYMVWQKATNTMRWTDGYRTFTYSSCGLQTRLNTQSWIWEQDPAIVIGGIVPPGACALAGESPARVAPAPPPAPAPAPPPPPPSGGRYSTENPAPASARSPDSYPCASGLIKGNRNSGIYHVPGGQFYGVTGSGASSKVDCFNTEGQAQAAGYRRSER